jgi:hypothetical protein
MPMKTKMPPMPEELAMATAEADDVMGAELSMAMPKPARPYSPKVATSLAQAVAEIAGLMGAELVPEAYSGAVEALDEDLVRFLAMIEAAAADYGSPLPMTLSELKGDAELTALTAFLMELAKDEGFAAFLNEGAEEGAEKEEDEVSEEAMDEDAMFMGRM